MERLIGVLVPALIQIWSNPTVQWKMEKSSQFPICETLSETLPFGSGYAMGILCAHRHSQNYLKVGAYLQPFHCSLRTDKEQVNKVELLKYTQKSI